MLLKELRSPHSTVLVVKTLFLQAFMHQENGRASNGQSRNSAGQKSVITPGTTLQVMQRGFGNPYVQQNSPGVPHCPALGAPMLVVPSLQKARAE